MAGTRFLIAGAILYSYRRYLAGDPMPTRLHWRTTAIVGLFLLVGGNGLVVWSEQRVPSGIAALLIGSTPLWIVLVDALVPGSARPGRQALAGVLLGFGGIVLLVGPARWAGAGQQIDLWGVAALLAASLSWAIGSIYARGAPLPGSALLGSGMEMLAGGSILLLVGTLSGEWGRLDPQAVTLRSLLSLGYLIVIGSLIGYASYTWLLQVATVTLISTYAYVNPLVAVLLGSLLAGEALTARILISAGVIIGSVVIINTARQKSPEPG
jgi:drug/metabolite transporter (DMT)-like permease